MELPASVNLKPQEPLTNPEETCELSHLQKPRGLVLTEGLKCIKHACVENSYAHD